MSKCACQSGQEYQDCCEPYIKGSRFPKTAEALMRSRYTAFTVADMDYIEKTTDPDKLADFDKEGSRDWAEKSQWTGLEVIDVKKGGESDHDGVVEFVANFALNDKPHRHHEIAEFHRREGRWFFFDGKLVQAPFVHAEPKTGRNDPCTCGSGKKYKKCCGA